MTLLRETLMAFVDGELSEDEARNVAAEVAQHPELLSYVEEQKALKAALGAAFAPILVQPVPPVLERAVRETPVTARRSFTASTIWRRLPRIWEPQSTPGRLRGHP